jgi:hypothetical protein
MLDYIRQLNLAQKLVESKAKGNTVLHFCPNISPDTIKRLYTEIHGKSAAKGLSPYSPEWFLTYRGAKHAMLFMKCYEALYNDKWGRDPYRLLDTFRFYLHRCEEVYAEPLFSFDRALVFMTMLDNNDLTVNCCVECGSSFPLQSFWKKGKCQDCAPPGRALPLNLQLRYFDNQILEAPTKTQ